ncbi:MAG TPA: hypothetical protein VLA88_02800 [Candidatus Saccharimonadales bacterium]|nr:hypothetical protein [Candidatus Saccharimonadales bacterium]
MPTHDPQSLLATQLSQLEITLQEATAIDAKTLAIVATDITLLIFMAQTQLHVGIWWLTFLMYLMFFVALVFAAIAVWPLNYKYVAPGINSQQLPSYLQMSEPARTIQLISTATYGTETNLALNAKRWRLCRLSIVFTVLGLLGLLLYYVRGILT